MFLKCGWYGFEILHILFIHKMDVYKSLNIIMGDKGSYMYKPCSTCGMILAFNPVTPGLYLYLHKAIEIKN